jgi:toxin-antitoxin system PIN domain toxin
MISFDTNIVVHSANTVSPYYATAQNFLRGLARRQDVMICEYMLVEVYLKLCNKTVFPEPMRPAEASAFCQDLRGNKNWRVIEAAPVMDQVWRLAAGKNFAFRRIIDLRLALTLRFYGVREFATTNLKDFQRMGFQRVWNPLEQPSA